MRRNRSSNKGEGELHAAARSGDIRAVQAIVATNPRALNSRDKHSRTPYPPHDVHIVVLGAILIIYLGPASQ